MGLRERFYDILTTGDLEAAGDSDERVVFGVILKELLDAVCAERIEQGGDHDWPIEYQSGVPSEAQSTRLSGSSLASDAERLRAGGSG